MTTSPALTTNKPAEGNPSSGLVIGLRNFTSRTDLLADVGQLRGPIHDFQDNRASGEVVPS